MKWLVSLILLWLSECVIGEKFLYFAYGSNLLADRIHINNPSAEFVAPATLDGYRLDFIRNSSYWHGAVATIVSDPEHVVWGALWNLDITHLASLDEQEGVHQKWYFAKTVSVTTKTGEVLEARTYEQTVNPPALAEHELLPIERRPSVTYLKVIIQGAIECDIPEEYIRYLYSIPHNGLNASAQVLERLNNLEAVFLYPGRYFPRPHLSSTDKKTK